jgi:hypothetical protein
VVKQQEQDLKYQVNLHRDYKELVYHKHKQDSYLLLLNQSYQDYNLYKQLEVLKQNNN